MEKVINIGGKDVALKTTGATPLRYRSVFGKDFFAEIIKLEKMGKKGGLESFDSELIYNLTWLMAKTHDNSIPPVMEWLDSFDEFPVMEVMPEVIDMVAGCIATKKK